LADCQSLTASLQGEVKKRDADLEAKNGQLKSLQEQLDYMKKTNTNLLDRLSDLSVINKSGAESIRKSLDALNEQGKYIKDLNSSIQKKDSVNLSLVMNLKRSLADVNDDDVSIEVKKGVVYISISDKLMFASGSARVSTKAEAVLAKVAKVVNDHKGLDILVEGHTDAVPISTPEFKDNWDLSAMRATSVVRLLQTKFGVDPERMTAGGRGEFEPQSGNNSRAGRKQNRRTEIIVTPKLDQFFDLLAAPAAK
jgi:chemotaxis protein MotB